MEKERRIKVLSVVALIIAVLGLTVAFAAMSRTLTINGTATMDTAKWDIHFENLNGQVNDAIDVNDETQAHMAENAAMGMINETGNQIMAMAAFNLPGDKVSYNFKIVNEGSIDAEITSVVFNQGEMGYVVGEDVTTIAKEASAEDIELYNKYFSYKLVYTDTGVEVKEGDELAANTEKNVTLIYEYSKDATDVPDMIEGNDDVESQMFASQNTLQIIYTQK